VSLIWNCELWNDFVLKEKDKQKEELSESMKKLDIEGSSSGSPNFKRKPVIIIVVGMAGQSRKDCIYFILHVWFRNEFDTITVALVFRCDTKQAKYSLFFSCVSIVYYM